MRDELAQVDAELRGLFMESNFDEMKSLLEQQPSADVKELYENAWNIIKKYYETERFDLLFQYFKFVAYSCFIVEYAYQTSLISKEVFEIMMQVYNDIYELKKQQSSEN